MIKIMKTLKLALYLLLATLVQRVAFADLVGPYTPDANTLFLFHFDEPAGSSVTANVGLKPGNAYTVINSTSGNGLAIPPITTTMLGVPGYVNGATNFGNCFSNTAAGCLVGYDFNQNGQYDGEVSGTSLSADRMAMTNLNMGNGGNSPWTMEALVRPYDIGSGSSTHEIICTDNSLGNTLRGFQFRFSAGTLQLQWIGGTTPTAVSGTIPLTGPDAYVAGNWYHVAAVYDGTTVTLYWTKLDPANGAAHVLNSGAMTIGTTRGAVLSQMTLGNENRNSSQEQFLGCIDEVRISSVARAANQMQFFSPAVTIIQNPVSQNIDYNQRVAFNVNASSLTLIGYQWRFNSNSIAGATNSNFVIANVAAADASYYDVVCTNTAGYAATSSPALLVVGAAHFLMHRYSFTIDTSDSVGAAWGTNFGTATVSGGRLVLDGSAGGYMQLPGGLYNGGNSSALTFDFWAAFGTSGSGATVFGFGGTNSVGTGMGVNYVTFSSRTSGGTHQMATSGGDVSFQQVNASAGVLDGANVHVTCVFDPPNNTMALYTNGVLEAVNTNLTVGIGNLNDIYSWIGRSLFTADAYLNASIDELRIYNGALSAISVKQSDDQGPNTILADGPAKFITQPANTAVPVGQTATFTVATVGYLPINYQWFKNGTLVPGATSASYTFATVLGDNNASFMCYATNTIGATTYVTNSSTATLTVFTPSTLARLDAANGGADSSWNTTSLDWTNDASGGGVIAFSQTNGVIFDSRGSSSPQVDINEAIVPYSITVNAASDYTFTSSANTGSLVGQGWLSKLNSGTLTIDVTNNMSGATTISGGKLQIGNSDSLGSLGGGPVTNNATLSFARAHTALAVPNAIHGSGTVSFDGAGAVTVSGASDYSGNTLINQGIVYLQSSTGLGSTTGGTTVANGAQLYITANVDLGEALTLTGAADGNGALRKGGAGLTTLNGVVSLAADSTIGLDGGATLVLSNTVQGAAMLTANGTGTLALNRPSTYSGGTMLNGPIINVNANSALGTGPVSVIAASRVVLGDGVNLANAVTASMVSPGAGNGLLMVNDNTNGTVTTISGPLVFEASPANGGHLVGPTSSGYLNVTGRVTNTTTGVISSRSGRVRFSGGGDYTSLMLNAGILSLGANNGLCPSATLTIGASADATFDLNGFNQSLTGVIDGATFQELITNSSAAPGTLTFNLSASSTYSGVIAGNVTLVENGSANLLLAGTNANTGNFTVNGGTLEFAQPSLGARSMVTVASGAILQLDFAGTNTVAGLVLNGVSQPLGVYSSTTSSPYINGSGSLRVAIPVATNPTNIVASVSGSTLHLSWPPDYIGWRLLIQTNHLAQGISTNPSDWGTVSGSAATNQVNLTIDPTLPCEFYRMVYP
jgi:autotransporter-associated beta strand protein